MQVESLVWLLSMVELAMWEACRADRIDEQGEGASNLHHDGLSQGESAWIGVCHHR